MPQTSIRRASLDDEPPLTALLQGYYTEQNISVRETVDTLQGELIALDLGFFLAQDVTGNLLGCVLVHALPSVSLHAAECKRLFVQPNARGYGLANRLLERVETEATRAGYRWLYLDSLDTFAAALRLYARRGFGPCERYPGSDPQATRFFRKPLLATF